MTPKDKARELFDKYEYFVRMYNDDTPRLDMQKQCALIAINEIIDSLTIKNYSDVDDYEYWKEVKTEIENL